MGVKWVHKPLLLMFCVILVAGCSAGQGKKAETQQKTLKIMFSDEGYFYQTYGDLFAMKYPNTEIEVVSTQSLYNGEEKDYNKAFMDLMDKEQPDVVMLDSSNYEEFVTEGKLAELDSLIERDKYDTETIFPGMLDLIKEKGGGKLYGLSPTFYGSVIYYNADLFQKYGIEPPHDGMTWQEILDTARRFPTDGDEKTRVYGFGSNYGMDFRNLASRIASSQGLQEINPNTLKVSLNTDSWKQVYKTALEALESNAVYNPKDGGFQGGSMQEYYQSQPFLMGRMAMTVESPYLLNNINEARSSVKDYKPFNIGLAAGPVDPSNPGETRDVNLGVILGIRANSPNLEAAWEFLKFVNGDEYAKIKSRTLNNGLLTRVGASKEYDGVSLEAFYKLKPSADQPNYREMEKIPSEFYEKYNPIFEREIALVEKKSKSIDEALETIQAEGQVLLDQAAKEQASKKENEASDKE